MSVFIILNHLFTNPKSDWINKLDDDAISPVIIQRFLSLLLASQRASRILNAFVYNLPKKMYLSVAWSLLFFDGKKLNKAPFIKYPKKEDIKDEYEVLFNKIRKELKLSENDFVNSKKFLMHHIKQEPEVWFSYYGMDKKYWDNLGLDYDKIKEYGKVREGKRKNTLEEFYEN